MWGGFETLRCIVEGVILHKTVPNKFGWPEWRLLEKVRLSKVRRVISCPAGCLTLPK